MALHPCRECGHSVSDLARTCPACGVSLAKRRPGLWWGVALLGLSVIAVIASWRVLVGGLGIEAVRSVVARGVSEETLTNEEKIALRQKVRRSSVKVSAFYANGAAGTGSGFVVKRLGEYCIVATNAHVIEDAGTLATHIELESATAAKAISAYPLMSRLDTAWVDYAFLVAYDPVGALGQEVEVASGIKPGSYVLAVGNPLGEDFLMDEGNVLEVQDVAAGSVIRHSALVEHGSSGGGLFDSAGRLVGINTALLGDMRTGVAIFSNEILGRVQAYHVSVDAQGDWQDSGILVSGESTAATVFAHGRWRVGAWAGEVPPAGRRITNGRSIDASVAHGALLARIGPTADPLPIDRWWSAPAPEDVAMRIMRPDGAIGTLRFRINDVGQHDNAGYMDVVVLLSS